MKTSLRTIFTAVLVILCAVYCTPSSDIDAINGRVDGLESRVSALEEKVKELNEVTVPGLKNLVNAIQNDNVFVTAVVEKENGYEIKFSDGTSALIQNGKDGKDGEDGIDGKDGKDGKDGVDGEDGKDGKDGKDGEDGTDGKDGTDGETPVIGITIVDGVYVWTVNGTVITDDDGNPLPVTGNNGKDGKDGTDGTDGVTPQFGIMDGHWIVSYDGGETWKTLGLTSNTDYSAYLAPDEETEDYIVLYVGSTRVEIPKEKTFTLKITIPENNGVKKGETASFAYTISGVSATDEVDVDIIGVSAGWEAEVVATDNASGVVKVTNNDDGDAKVTVYAANHKGKTDIRTLKFEGGKLSAVIETKDITSEGGELPLEITTNLDYSIIIPEAAQSWISCVEVKSVHTDKYTLTIAANDTGAYRSATVQVVDAEGNSVKDIEVFQYPNPEVTTSIASVVALADNTKADLFNVTVVAASKVSTIVTDGTDYTYVADTTLAAGTVVNITGGTKKTDGLGLAYLSGAKAAAVTGATPVVVDEKAAFKYYRYTSFQYFVTATNGIITKSGDNYIFNSAVYSGFKYVLEAPVDELNIDDYLGKLVSFKGWGKSIIAGSSVAAYTFSVIPVEIKEVEIAAEPAWTVSYEGDSGDEEYPELVKNTVAAPLAGEYYAFVVIPGGDIPAGGSIPDVILEAALNYSDDLHYSATLYRTSYSFDQILNIYGYTDTDSETFEEFGYGDTYLAAIGLDSLGRVNGKYSYTVYNKPDPAVNAAYEDFLGKWEVPLANGSSSFWSITEKDKGSTYNITGIEGISEFSLSGEAAVVEGVYADGKFTISVQTVGNTFAYGGNNCQYLLSGINASGSYTTDDVVITRVAKMPDGTLEIRSANSFAAMRYIRLNLSGSGAWYGSGNSTSLPNIATVAPFIAEYEDYLGFWTIERSGANDTWKITVKEEGVSYWISGIGGWADKVTANFNSGNGTLTIPVQKDLFSSNHNTYGPLSVGLRGYYINGSSNTGINGSYDIATFAYKGEDVCEISQTTVTVSGTQRVIAGFQWYASILEGQYAGYALTYTNVTPVAGLSLVKVKADVGEYNKWIGSWNVGEEVWTVTKDIEGYTYTVTGIQETDIPFSASFDSDSKSFVLSEQADVANVALNDTLTVSISLFGNFTYNETNYYYGDGLDIASATLGAGNTATLTGLNISATYGDFTGFSVYGEQVGGDGFYNFGSMTLPQAVSAYTPGSVKPSSVSRKHVRRSYDVQCEAASPVLSRNDVSVSELKAVKAQPKKEKLNARKPIDANAGAVTEK